MKNNQQVLKAKAASRKLAIASSRTKNQALNLIAEYLIKYSDKILAANFLDIAQAEKKGVGVMIDRLKLTKKSVFSIKKDIENVIKLKDPIGEILEDTTRPNGLKLKRVRVPLGVVLEIYESRPNVTIDAAVLAIKSGNAIILKGGSDAINTNRILVKIMKEALKNSEISQDAIQLIDSRDQKVLQSLLKLRNHIDVVIPRGGKGLIDFVIKNSSIPVIETGASVVHTYVDNEADLSKAVEIVFNEKTQRPSVCNALDTLLVHREIATKILPVLSEKLKKFNVEIRADIPSFKILKSSYPNLKKAQSKDFDTEFLDYILAVKIVKDLDEALEHIYKHSLKHSESIITENKVKIKRFLNEVDAACVFANASTRFADGGQFGLGAEIGISTQKLHARGPFALEGLTTYKWIAEGEGVGVRE